MLAPRSSALVAFCAACLLAPPGHAAEPAPTPRGTDAFGDPLPLGAVARIGSAALRFKDEPCGIAFSSDGKRLAVALPYQVSVWTVSPRAEVVTFRVDGGGHLPQHVSFAPDGKTLLTVFVSRQGHRQGKVWDAETGAAVRRFGGPLEAAAFSPDGKSFVAVKGGDDAGIVLFDALTGKERLRLKGGGNYINQFAFVDGGKTVLAHSSGGEWTWWDAASGKVLRELRDPFAYSGVPVALRPDGKRIATYNTGFESFSVADLTTGELSPHFRDQGGFLAFSADCKRIAAVRRDRLRLLDSENGKEQRSFPLPSPARGPACFSPDGKWLAIVHGHRVALWPLDQDPMSALAWHDETVTHAVFAPDGKTVFTACYRGPARAWDARTGAHLRAFGDPWGSTYGQALSPDGKTVAVAREDELCLWDTAGGKLLHTIKHPGVRQLRFAADGKTLLGHGGHQVRVWDSTTGKELRALFDIKTPYGLLAPDGRTAASIDMVQFPTMTNSGRPATFPGDTIRLWDLTSGKQLRASRDRPLTEPKVQPLFALAAQGPPVGGVCFSPDGQLLAWKEGEKFRLWEVPAGKELPWLPAEPKFHELGCFSVDNRLLAITDPEGIVRLLERATGRVRHRIVTGQGQVTCIVFSPDGTRLATGGTDTSLLIWDVSAPPGFRPSRALSRAEWENGWDRLGVEDAEEGFRAIATLAAVPGPTLPLAGERLRAFRPDDARRVPRLVRELDDDRFAVRSRAAAELRRIGEPARPALERAAKEAPSVEARERAGKILEAIARDRPVPTAERLRAVRALEAVERVGGPEAIAVLRGLAKDAADADVRREAAASLGRLAAR